jgi:uncharacterized membrane protein
MQRREIGVMAIALGVIAVLLALLADPLGIGGNEDTFGWKQVVLLVVGLVIAATGVVAILWPGAARREAGRAASEGGREPSAD